MKNLRINRSNNQTGFTLIETIIGVAIIGIIAAATAASVSGVFSGSGLSSSQMTAISNVRNAGDWITRDAQEAQSYRSTIGEGSLVDSTMSLVWYDYDYDPDAPDPTKMHEVIYTIPLGTTDLMRSEDGGTPIVVARNVTATRTFISKGDKNILQFTITSTAGNAANQATEQRKFEIRLRPER